MNVQFREAKRSDIPWMVSCGKRTPELWSSKISGWFKEQDLQAFIEKYPDDIILLIAEMDLKPVGFIFIQKLRIWSFCFGLYIEEEFRKLGIGKQLIESAEKKLFDEGIPELDLLVEKENIKAQIFYKKMGFDRGFEFYWMNKMLQKKSK